MVIRRGLLAVVLIALAQSSYAQSAADAAYKASLLANKLSQVQGIVANPLGGAHCIAGNSNVTHDLGVVPTNAHVRIRFQSNFDPVASVMLLRLGADAVTAPSSTRTSDAVFYDDDDTGGLLEPLLDFTMPHAASLYVFVSQFGTAHGTVAKCYDIEVTVTPPPLTTTPLRR